MLQSHPHSSRRHRRLERRDMLFTLRRTDQHGALLYPAFPILPKGWVAHSVQRDDDTSRVGVGSLTPLLRVPARLSRRCLWMYRSCRCCIAAVPCCRTVEEVDRETTYLRLGNAPNERQSRSQLRTKKRKRRNTPRPGLPHYMPIPSPSSTSFCPVLACPALSFPVFTYVVYPIRSSFIPSYLVPSSLA